MEESLAEYVDLCLWCLEGNCDKEIANQTGLSLSTIRRLKERDYSIRIQWRTLYNLGYAAGLRLNAHESDYTIHLI